MASAFSSSLKLYRTRCGECPVIFESLMMPKGFSLLERVSRISACLFNNPICCSIFRVIHSLTSDKRRMPINKLACGDNAW